MPQLLEVELFRDCLSRDGLVGRFQYWFMRARAGMVFSSHSRVEVRRISKVDKLCTVQGTLIANIQSTFHYFVD